MSRLAQTLVFFALAFGILGGVHYYIWARLVRDTRLPEPWRRVVTWALVGLGLSMPLMGVLGRRLPPEQLKWLAWPSFVWMGFLLLFFFLLVAADLVRLIAFLAGKARRDGRVVDPERRLAMGRLAGGAVAVATGGLGVLALRQGLGPVEVKEVTVPLQRLPRALDGLTIAQLTDVHVGPTIGRDFVEEIVEKTNALRPDIIAITGDLVDGSVERLRERVAPLGRLSARFGVYFVTGNHEYYSGADEWIAELRRLGIRVLRNERVTLGDGDALLELAGVDDYSSRGYAPGHGPDLKRALAGRDPARPLILLAHQPRAIHEAAQRGVGLQLSGHTHGGQIWPWSYFVRLQQPYVRGLHQVGDTFLYVSCGTGYWGPPMRLGAPAEVTRIVLRAPG